MAGAVFVFNFGIILRTRVGILDEQADGRAQRPALENAGEYLDPVFFLPLGGEAVLPRLAAVEVMLDIGFGERQARRHAVDDAADGRAVAFAPGRVFK